MKIEPPAVADPMVRPVTVTVTAVLRAIVPAVMVMTIWVAVGATMVPVTPPLIKTPKVPAEVVKKPDGYVSVIVLLVASAPPAEVVNENVAAADALPATRSSVAIVNEGSVG